MDFTFRKAERLSRKKLIDELFKDGSSFYLHPFKVYHLEKEIPAGVPVQVLMAVPAKKFPHAVDRNRIRRMMREAYRLNKHELYFAQEKKKLLLLIGFLYAGKKIEPYAIINAKMVDALSRLLQHDKNIEKHIG
jgi:ribonuclease P protein component